MGLTKGVNIAGDPIWERESPSRNELSYIVWPLAQEEFSRSSLIMQL